MDVCFQGISPDANECCQQFYHNNVLPSTHSDEEVELDIEDHNNSNPQNCCYDADASNDSTELNLSSSHDDSDHNHHHLVGENDKLPPPPADIKNCEIRPPTINQQKKQPFVPFSEETVFLDPTIEEAPLPSISTSSPVSGDSWMNYSNSNSSDDFSGISEHIKAVTSGRCTGNNSSDEGSTDFHNTIINQSGVLMKRLRSREEDEDDDRDELIFTPENSSSSQTKGTVKRSRTHNKYHNDDILLADDEDDDRKNNKKHFQFVSSTPNAIPAASPVETPRKHNFSNNKCSSKLSHLSKSLDYTSSTQDSAICRDSSSTPISISPKNALVDIRLIDFAHTTIVPRRTSITSNVTQTTPVLHHGPDGGFLTGLDSLNRLLNEILAEEN